MGILCHHKHILFLWCVLVHCNENVFSKGTVAFSPLCCHYNTLCQDKRFPSHLPQKKKIESLSNGNDRTCVIVLFACFQADCLNCDWSRFPLKSRRVFALKQQFGFRGAFLRSRPKARERKQHCHMAVVEWGQFNPAEDEACSFMAHKWWLLLHLGIFMPKIKTSFL